jgi:hypothetical protein
LAYTLYYDKQYKIAVNQPFGSILLGSQTVCLTYDTMRFFHAALFIAPLALGVQVDRRGREIYDGYKVFRVVTDGATSDFEDQLRSLSAVELSRNRGHVDTQHFDIAVPPESLDAFGALNYEAETLTEDLGADIALEGELQPFPGQSP